ncbi:MAG: hypothetical protein R2748_11230 [Bryobacterales bacterium]
MFRFLGLFFAVSIGFMSAEDLDVRRVVLYKHGVGFFERAGEIPAGESAVLQFKAEEMDDVLKSLTVEQTGGEGVSAVRYDSSDPLSKRLEVFPFRLGTAMQLSAILDQFKGAEVELELGRGPLTGTIVSARQLPPTEDNSGRSSWCCSPAVRCARSIRPPRRRFALPTRRSSSSSVIVSDLVALAQH